jgi:hypothetical protein
MDHAALMKDLTSPVSAFLRAADLDSVCRALFDIFGNLRKLRKSAYPVGRAVKLVQVSSLAHCPFPAGLVPPAFKAPCPAIGPLPRFERPDEDHSCGTRSHGHDVRKLSCILFG